MRRDISEGRVNASTCELRKRLVFLNKSRRKSRVILPEDLAANLLAIMFPKRATSENPSITKPRIISISVSFLGTASSIM